MLKKAGVAVGIAAAALLAASPLAFADDDSGDHVQVPPGVQDQTFQHKEKHCNKKYFEGVIPILSSHQHNEDSHHGHCKQENEGPDDD